MIGIAKFAKDLEEKPKIELNFAMDKQGMVRLASATSVVAEGEEATAFEVKRVFDGIGPVVPMQEAAIKGAMDQLAAMDKIDQKRVEKANARNALETYIYKAKLRIEEGLEEEGTLAETSTEEEREAATVAVSKHPYMKRAHLHFVGFIVCVGLCMCVCVCVWWWGGGITLKLLLLHLRLLSDQRN